MRVRKLFPLLALAAVAAVGTLPATSTQQGQLPQINAPGRIGPTPPAGSGGCSVKQPTCAEVAPLIIRSALGPSPIEENFRQLARAIGAAGPASEQNTVQWIIQAFGKSGVDARAEAYQITASGSSASPQGANVVAEIRGWRKPDEIVILGAPIDSRSRGAGAMSDAYDAAVLIDAARAIHAAGTLPSRSIRFVLFIGPKSIGSWAYVKAHRAELDHIDAAIIYNAADARVTGYDLDGRKSLEAPLREALAPAAQFDPGHDTDSAELGAASFDFLLEGVPALITNRQTDSGARAKNPLTILKRDVVVAALTAYGIADLPQRLGPRWTRTQVEQLLDRSGLEKQMKASGIWPEWEQGERGRPR